MIDVKKVLSAIVDKYQQKPVLLWTNLNPSASFAPQTISLDLSGYDEVRVDMQQWGNDPYAYIIPIGKEVTAIKLSEVLSSASVYIQARKVSVASNGVTFGSGGYRYIDLSSFTTDNSRVIPYKIYGIK